MSTFGITPADLEAEWRALSPEEVVRSTRLIAMVGALIKSRRPDIADDDPAAQGVVIDVVISALGEPESRGFSSFSKTVGPRSISGTVANPGGEIAFKRWHCQALGIPVGAMPLAYFGDGPVS